VDTIMINSLIEICY